METRFKQVFLRRDMPACTDFCYDLQVVDSQLIEVKRFDYVKLNVNEPFIYKVGLFSMVPLPKLTLVLHPFIYQHSAYYHLQNKTIPNISPNQLVPIFPRELLPYVTDNELLYILTKTEHLFVKPLKIGGTIPCQL